MKHKNEDIPALVDRLLKIADTYELCYVCPFDGGGVDDCECIKDYGKCAILRAVDLLEERKSV